MSWRSKEIYELTSAVKRAEGRNANVHVRCGIALLYAHWEGFIKDTANSYVNYLSYRADASSSLIPSLVALSLRAKFSEASASSRSKVVVPMVRYLIESLDSPVDLPRSRGISTESNLSSAVFENIAGWIGLDTEGYSARYPIIDDVLLPSRNGIAHGEHLVVSKERYLSLVEEVTFLMRMFKTDVENSVAQKSFLRVA